VDKTPLTGAIKGKPAFLDIRKFETDKTKQARNRLLMMWQALFQGSNPVQLRPVVL
jgi:hypothetical protein